MTEYVKELPDFFFHAHIKTLSLSQEEILPYIQGMQGQESEIQQLIKASLSF